MFHGTADDFVPIFNSNDALAAMNARGANQVTVVPIPGGNHTTSYPTYFLGALAYFNSLK
jgi:dipeptidyl aminopeptidase/acylaminoacyl peptidase